MVALGIGIGGTKHPLAVEEGSTKNATLATGLVTGLRARGLDVTQPILAVLDAAKALWRAVTDVVDQPLIQRCQQHKIKNARDKLPKRLRAVAERPMRQALPRRISPQSREPADRAGGRTGPAPTPARRSLREGHGRDPDYPAPGRAAHPGSHAALHQRSNP